MSPLISVEAYLQLIKEKNIILIDARSGPNSFERYQDGHLPGAIHIDLDKDLTRKPEDAAQGGRHPLPDITIFAALLGRLGIIPSSHVIVYDDKSGTNAAARFWWMMRAAGHEQVQVIDGGLKAVLQKGLELTKGIEYPMDMTLYPIRDWQLPLADMKKVEEATADKQKIVIDVREEYRYAGESEPIDLVAGHIPGAINIPYTGNLDKEGNFLSTDELVQKYAPLVDGKDSSDIIVHCGSGVTACHTLLALEQAGISGASLYVGSWSEWSRNDKPIATGKN